MQFAARSATPVSPLSMSPACSIKSTGRRTSMRSPPPHPPPLVDKSRRTTALNVFVSRDGVRYEENDYVHYCCEGGGAAASVTTTSVTTTGTTISPKGGDGHNRSAQRYNKKKGCNINSTSSSSSNSGSRLLSCGVRSIMMVGRIVSLERAESGKVGWVVQLLIL